MLKLGGSGKT